jgi:CRP-like cAMP-binding protein
MVNSSEKRSGQIHLSRTIKIITIMLAMIHSNSPWKRGWDLCIAALTLGNALFLPLYAVFGFSSAAVVLFALLVLLFFILDMLLEFFTAFHHEGELVTSLSERGRHYLGHGFLPDLLALSPGLLLFSLGVLEGGSGMLLLVLPLFKLLKVNRTIRRSGENLINPAIFRLLLLVFWILMAAHLIACCWILVSGNPDNLGSLDLYIQAFYWTITTLTTIGYGDITPVGRSQTLFVILIEMFGAAMYGLVIGNIAGLIANIDIAKRDYREKLDMINAFLKYRNIPAALMNKINSYYSYLWETRKGYDEVAFLHELPMALKESVALHLNKEIIERVPLFEMAEESLIRDIILQLEPVVFTPDDYIVRAGELGRDMFFISRGSVNVISADETVTYASLASGQFFGEISLLLSMPRTATIKATGFCDLYRLGKESFDAVIERYPDFKESIRVLAEKRKEEVEALRKQRQDDQTPPAASESAAETELHNEEDSGSEQDLSSVPVPVITNIRARRSSRGLILVWEGSPDTISYDVARWDQRRNIWRLSARELPRPVWTDEAPEESSRYRIRGKGAGEPGPWSGSVKVSVENLPG